jgi:hypothetical protein
MLTPKVWKEKQKEKELLKTSKQDYSAGVKNVLISTFTFEGSNGAAGC